MPWIGISKRRKYIVGEENLGAREEEGLRNGYNFEGGE